MTRKMGKTSVDSSLSKNGDYFDNLRQTIVLPTCFRLEVYSETWGFRENYVSKFLFSFLIEGLTLKSLLLDV